MSSETATPAGFSEEELRVYFGRNADYYVAAWHAGNSGHGQRRFNWAAFLLTTLWLLYRKLYLAVALALAAVWTLLIVSAGYVPLPVLWAVIGIVNLLMCFVVGRYGNNWYLRKARRTLEQVRSIEPVREARLQALRKRGGTSIIASIIAPVIAGVLGAVLANWSEYDVIDQSQMSFEATETESLYHNPKYGVTLRLPGTWHTVEGNSSYFCDLENPAGMIAAFRPMHYYLTLEQFYGDFKQNMTAGRRYKAEGESDFMVSNARGKQLLLRAADNGMLLVVTIVKKGSTVYLLTVVFLQPEIGEVSADHKHQRDEVFRRLRQAVGIN